MTLDRRRFIQVAGAMAAGPSLLDTAIASGQAPAFSGQAPHVVVIGAGSWGGWTALYLRQLGAEVTLVDQYGPGNSRATSGDETRGVRCAYADKELWTKWASESLRRWKAWNEEWSRDLRMQLFFTTGDLIVRAEWDDFLAQTAATYDKLGIRYERLTADEVRHRWPVIDTKDMTVALYEPDAGVARARRSCEAVAEVARQRGAKIVTAHARLGSRAGTRLNDVALNGGDVLRADAFVFACGPWLAKALPDAMERRIRTPLGNVYYFGVPADDHRFFFPNLPSYNFPGVTGWPALPADNRGFRVRGGGGANPEQDPDLSPRYIDAAALERPREFLAQRFPLLKDAPLVQTHACHYEFSVSRNFIVDRHPQLENVWIAGAGNAEGFKQGPTIGEYIAQRVLGMPTDRLIDEQFKLSPDQFDPPAAPGK